MKETHKLPVVLAMLFVLIFAQAAGYYFTRSLAVLAFSLVIFVFAFNVLISFAKTFDLTISEDESKNFRKSQLKSVLLNSIVMIFFAVITLVKIIKNLNTPKELDTLLIGIFAVIALVVGIVYSSILFSETKNHKHYKALFVGAMFTVFAAILLIVEALVYTKIDFPLIDSYLGIFFMGIIIVQAVVLIVRSLRNR